MSLREDQVASAYALLTGRFIALEEAAKKAELLYSREELVAHLVTVENALRDAPAARAKLLSVAKENYARSATPRPERTDGIAPRAAKLHVAGSLEHVIKEGNSASARIAYDAIVALSLVSDDYSSEYHWRVQSEA